MSRIDIEIGHKGDQFFIVEYVLNGSNWDFKIHKVFYSMSKAVEALGRMTYRKE